MSLRQRQPRQEDSPHRKFVGSLPCLICGNEHCSEAAHIRMADQSIAKPSTGMQQKSDDKFTVPLCNLHHAAQHSMNERYFWQSAGIDPVKVALALYSVTGDHAAGCRIVYASRDR
jgi:hypothetical protein